LLEIRIQFLKYLVVSSINVILGYLIYLSLVVYGASIELSLLANYLFGISFSYFANQRIVFKVLDMSRLWLYFIIHIALLIFNIYLLKSVESFLNYDKLILQAVLVFPLALVNFAIMKFIVFNKKHPIM
jgi:putative flippase GtrA